MLILAIKCYDVKGQKPGEFDRAWYRIVNEDTNQTLDYKNFKDIPKPEGFSEEQPPAGEEGAAEPPSLTYIAGRIYLDANNRWVYESYNHNFASDKFPDLYEALTAIHKSSEQELK